MILTHVDLIEKLLKYVPCDEKREARDQVRRRAERQQNTSRTGANGN
jgi:hypothetical protein